jgi:hypothetical protein
MAMLPEISQNSFMESAPGVNIGGYHLAVLEET